jgi:hypothetical protein
VRLPFGASRWTVPAAESEVLVAAAGAMPVRVAAAGAVAGVPVRVALRALPTAGVLGIAEASRLVRVGPAVRGGRACRLHAGTSLPEFEPLSFSFLAPRVLLPTDYFVEVGGQERVASWRGDRWVLR